MIQRCTNPNNIGFSRYGGRGIKVCRQWISDFDQFKRDMGLPPSPIHQLDRINNDGDYTPENCQWSTPSRNSFNRDYSKRSRTGYLNVSSRQRNNSGHEVSMKYQQTRVYVGSYNSAEEAAWMADQYRIGLWGESAKLNFEYFEVTS